MPTGDELRATAEAAATCTRCELYRRATQTVFGAGVAGADVMLVGEQPGDREDLVRGQVLDGPDGLPVVVTVHPSAALWARDRAGRRRIRAGIASDLTTARHAAG